MPFLSDEVTFLSNNTIAEENISPKCKKNKNKKMIKLQNIVKIVEQITMLIFVYPKIRRRYVLT